MLSMIVPPTNVLLLSIKMTLFSVLGCYIVLPTIGRLRLDTLLSCYEKVKIDDLPEPDCPDRTEILLDKIGSHHGRNN